MKNSKRPKIGLALGSGGARGLAHIGVIKVLEKEGIPIDVIAGSSIGAWVGGIYAIDRKLSDLEYIVNSTSHKQIASLLFDFTWKGGLVNGTKLAAHINTQMRGLDFSELEIPFAAVATDMGSGETRVFREGNVSNAIMASLTLPMIFKPVRMNRKVYLDGGLSQPVPAAVAKELGADIVIAVNLDGKHLLSYRNSGNPISVLVHSFNIFRRNLAKYTSASADIVIEPNTQDKGLVNFGGFVNGNKTVKAGERAMQKQIGKLKSLISLQAELKKEG